MLPSELLRMEISQRYSIELEQYKWSEEFLISIFSIELDKTLESYASKLEEIYINGFNIGHCGLTSRYIARKFSQAKLYYGTANLLVGTKLSPNGEHAWLVMDDFLIDTTLMICIPLSMAEFLGYVPNKQIAPESARMLSENDVYDHEFRRQQNIIKTKKMF